MTDGPDAGDLVDTDSIDAGTAVTAEHSARRRFLAERAAGLPGPGRTAPEDRLRGFLLDAAPLMTDVDATDRARRLAVELVGLGPIETLLAEPGVTDVLVNGPGRLWVERDGVLQERPEHLDRAMIERAVERLVGPLGLRADRSSPIVDARLADGTRVAVVLPPLAVDGPVLALRRHRTIPVALDQFGDPATVGLLRSLIVARNNVVVHGATGSGKTTLVNSMLGEVPASERIVTIEDVAELRIPGDHVVRLEARPGTAEGVGRTEIRDLVRTALRLRPDRIVVGEVRGAEALDMVWAMATGHRGSISTCHAASPEGALRRLETMCSMADASLPIEAIRLQLFDAVDVFVGLERDADGAHRISSVARLGADGRVRDVVGARAGAGAVP